MYQISYNTFLGFYTKTTRVFNTKKGCVQWLRQIGKPELISRIKKGKK